MRYIKAIYIGLIGMLLAGCQADQWEGIEGGFQITLSDEVTVTTKSTPAELGEPTTDKFKLKIVNEATNNVAYDGAYKSGTIPAAAGTYTITATFGSNPVLALDDPYYKGEETGVEVKDGETTSVSISCSVANALATIFYADTAKFDEMYSSYGVEVKVNNSSVTIGDGTKKSAYYQAGSKPTFTFKGILKGNNKEVSKVLENGLLSSASTFEARQHCKLTLSLETTASGLVPTISKAEATTVTINETIPMEWLPAPKINGFNDDNQTSLTYTETEDALSAQLRFSGSLAIQDVEFSFNFEDPQEKFRALNNKSFVLSELTEDDRSLLNTASIILPNLDGTNNGQFDFTAMTSSLQTKENGEETTNTIKLRVKANNRWSSEEPNVYEIRTVKPEFSISVNEANCWSREFTIEEITVSEGKGNLEKIKENLIYQYYNGNDWVECTTRDNVKGRTQQFTEAAENITTKEYKVRALYRGAIASLEDTATLETPTQLPNSGMEEWYEEDQSSHKNLWFPYVQGSEENVWTTNNLETTNYRGESYCSTSAVKQTTYKNTGSYAAWIRTVGHGIANTSVGSLWGINGSITGTHTIGELLFSNKFSVRPTNLIFTYRYIPNGDDVGIVELKIENQEKGIVLFETNKEIISNNNYTTFDIPIDYLNIDTATHLTLIFKSGSKHTDVVIAKVRGDGADEHYGSELYIDDISLVYDK